MLDYNWRIKASKLLSYMLRHNPEKFGLKLDPEGWVSIDDLLSAMRAYNKTMYRSISRDDLIEINEKNTKKRFEIEETRIRALYGHSTKDRVEKKEIEPPEILFHGTSRNVMVRIWREGLKPMGRQYVHLSTDYDTAWKVGRRKTPKPVVMEIMAKKAYQDGIKFYLGNEDIWLADPIPAKYVKKEATG